MIRYQRQVRSLQQPIGLQCRSDPSDLLIHIPQRPPVFRRFRPIPVPHLIRRRKIRKNQIRPPLRLLRHLPDQIKSLRRQTIDLLNLIEIPPDPRRRPIVNLPIHTPPHRRLNRYAELLIQYLIHRRTPVILIHVPVCLDRIVIRIKQPLPVKKLVPQHPMMPRHLPRRQTGTNGIRNRRNRRHPILHAAPTLHQILRNPRQLPSPQHLPIHLPVHPIHKKNHRRTFRHRHRLVNQRHGLQSATTGCV
ncbi:MAG: hypothetical protein BWY71_02193 [Planctomycetes bacterium ADurb.Bin412]|nr:MAG: hypothetical protein BWY71_02193 [Planctomycetes bacterium ADurb.Bin412]